MAVAHFYILPSYLAGEREKKSFFPQWRDSRHRALTSSTGRLQIFPSLLVSFVLIFSSNEVRHWEMPRHTFQSWYLASLLTQRLHSTRQKSYTVKRGVENTPTLTPLYEDRKFLLNIGTYLPDYTAAHPPESIILTGAHKCSKKSRNHLKILGARRVRSEIHNEDPLTVRAIV
jgi:hypothetical protein